MINFRQKSFIRLVFFLAHFRHFFFEIVLCLKCTIIQHAINDQINERIAVLAQQATRLSLSKNRTVLRLQDCNTEHGIQFEGNYN